MARKELKEQLDVFETYINDIPLVIDPCRDCEFIDDNKESHFNNTNTCEHCCWYYASNFKLKEKK